ncbi:MAG: indole-3-glycerol-phosphate synthase [Candidatus Altiarchaeota archaeon]|nr:indole-3-glycerol-phosphate synthase [Candidatus Altiarchaeota archaeon]
MKFNIDAVRDEKLREVKALSERRSLISAIERAGEMGFNPVIAEVKKKSPSHGAIREVDPVEAAMQMEEGRACGISVLTDKHFDGKLCDLREVKKALKIPVLRKDFIVDEFQVYESYGAGADAVLLIASLLRGKTKQFVDLAHRLGMEALVEAHSEDELEIALDSGARLIGINNRDLRTLGIELGTTEDLAKKIPKNKIVVSESGIKTKDDMERLKKAGAKAFLIGTSIIMSENIKEKVMEFVK